MPAEDNLDAAAAEGAVGAVVPLLNMLSGGGGELAIEQPTTRRAPLPAAPGLFAGWAGRGHCAQHCSLLDFCTDGSLPLGLAGASLCG